MWSLLPLCLSVKLHHLPHVYFYLFLSCIFIDYDTIGKGVFLHIIIYLTRAIIWGKYSFLLLDMLRIVQLY